MGYKDDGKLRERFDGLRGRGRKRTDEMSTHEDDGKVRGRFDGVQERRRNELMI